ERDIPGLEALATADLAVFFLRWRALPQEQLRPIRAYLDSGRPVIGFRTSTHLPLSGWRRAGEVERLRSRRARRALDHAPRPHFEHRRAHGCWCRRTSDTERRGRELPRPLLALPGPAGLSAPRRHGAHDGTSRQERAQGPDGQPGRLDLLHPGGWARLHDYAR